MELGTLPNEQYVSCTRACCRWTSNSPVALVGLNALGNFAELRDSLLSSNFNSFRNQSVESGVHMASVNKFEDLIQGQAQALILMLINDWLLANYLLFSEAKEERSFSHWPPFEASYWPHPTSPTIIRAQNYRC
jgi:hypothetical protein